jgi:hypothetical protein
MIFPERWQASGDRYSAGKQKSKFQLVLKRRSCNTRPAPTTVAAPDLRDERAGRAQARLHERVRLGRQTLALA